MPSNPFKPQQRCYEALNGILKKLPAEGMNKKLLIFETLTQYPVSKRCVEDYIDAMTETGRIKEEYGTLLPVKTASQEADEILGEVSND